MLYYSSRSEKETCSAAQAIVKGLASDGGLFMPAEIPSVSQDFIQELLSLEYKERAVRILSLYLDEFTADELRNMAGEAYGPTFNEMGKNAPVRVLDDNTAVMELYHGPTCAFKDMALQIMPRLLVSSLRKTGEEREVCILVATSGDTGKAALEGFRDVPGTRIQVFYPEDGVSDVQKLQMRTQGGNNVSVCAVEGNFDDAQSGVKAIFSDREFAEKLHDRGFFLSSANSINWGRLLPQIVYYFSAYCDLVNAGSISFGDKLSFCVPTGNFGDILAGWYAKRMGLPVEKLICASNDNRVLTDFFQTGVYDRNRPFYQTSSPSMDILISSNLERQLSHLAGTEKVAQWMEELKSNGRFDVGDTVRGLLGEEYAAGCCNASDAAAEIALQWNDRSYLMDPHTAVASRVLREYRQRSGDNTTTVIVSTASPYKFCDSVLRALGEEVNVPGTELIHKLEEKTGWAAPAPLTGLKERTVRFSDVVAKDQMLNAVDHFLK